MSKKAKKKDKEEIIQKYQNEGIIESELDQIAKDDMEINNLKTKLTSLSLDFRKTEDQYSQNQNSIKIILNKRIKLNEQLNEKYTKIKEERDEIEQNFQKNFERQFEELQKEKESVIKKANEDMEKMKEEYIEEKTKKKTLKKEVAELNKEVQKINNITSNTIQEYEIKIKDLNEKHTKKFKQTIEIFEHFLQNNQELLTTDLYSIYKELKEELNIKNEEFEDYKLRNGNLNIENKKYKNQMNNNIKIIDNCAQVQVQGKKKNQNLIDELEKKNKIIEQMKSKYEEQLEKINSQFNNIVNEDQNEIKELKNKIQQKNKELNDLKSVNKEILDSRTNLESFFLEKLKEVKKEIVEKKKKDIERKKSYFPYLNVNNKVDLGDSLYLTNIKNINVNDIDHQSKDRIIRSLFNKINDEKKSIGNFKKKLKRDVS
jgi:chromosome segregation ATPase